MNRKFIVFLSVMVLLAIGLSACAPSEIASPAPQQVPDENTTGDDASQADANDKGGQDADNDPETAPVEPTPTPVPAAEPPPAADAFASLPALPQPIQITSSGNRMLEGMYYPAKVDNAPVVILMHWAKGTMDDWQVIAPWLQNRLDEVDVPQPASGNYYDISWFPPMPEDISFAVVVFNFGNFGSSQFDGDRESWVWDAIAAFQFTSALEGVDPQRMAAIGASIGADGTVDSCYLFNDAGDMGTCIGALSLSPGNYLTEDFSYPEAAGYVETSGYPVWCLAAENDYESPALCSVLVGDHARSFIFAGSDHGMDLVSQDHAPQQPALPDVNTMMIIQEFLEVSFGTALNDFSIP